MDEEQVPAIANRSQRFGEGMIHGQASPPESLQAEANRFNASVPKVYRPSGSGIGMSAGQAEATYSGLFRNANGSAADTYQSKKFFPEDE